MTTMHNLIREWHRSQWDADYGLEGVRLVTGCTLWGQAYVDNFLAYCAPTLRANRLADVAYVLFVDGPTERRLAGIELGAARVQLRRLPEPIVQGLYAEPGHKYPLLAAVHNLLVHQAGKVGAGFHMTVADTVYSDRYFENLDRLSLRHEAIAHTGFAIVDWSGLPALDWYRRGRTLPLSAEHLGHIGWSHLNPQWASWNMNAVPDDFSMMPNSHYIHWRGRDTVRIHCAHQSAAWIGPERCRKVEPPLGGTIDSELPRYFAGAEPYQPVRDDDMAYIVIAGATQPEPLVPFDEFKAEFWRFIGDNRAFLPIWEKPCVMRVPVDESAPSDAELDRRLAGMLAKLEEGK
jgi:hypothetical protein